MKISNILILITVFITSAPTLGWNESGHRQIAYVTYELLDSATRTRVIQLIKEHPRYLQDFIQQQPTGYAQWPQEARERWLFSQIAVWPDLARDIAHPEEKKRYHRSKWHFINLPFFPNANLARASQGKKPGHTRMTTDRLGNERNIMQILDYLQARFKSRKSAMPRAVQLCWLFHLVGDIHQPMHTISLYTPNKFPDGDRGGNLIITGTTNLHQKWDSAAGYRSHHSYLQQRASQFVTAPTFTSIGKTAAQELSLRAWLEESYLLAKDHVYGFSATGKPSIAEAAVAFETGKAQVLRVKLGSAYEKNMRLVSERRIVEAGYRLAALLMSGNYL